LGCWDKFNIKSVLKNNLVRKYTYTQNLARKML
jgi:hypothetical protein